MQWVYHLIDPCWIIMILDSIHVLHQNSKSFTCAVCVKMALFVFRNNGPHIELMRFDDRSCNHTAYKSHMFKLTLKLSHLSSLFEFFVDNLKAYMYSGCENCHICVPDRHATYLTFVSFDDRSFSNTAYKSPMFTLNWKINQFDSFVDHVKVHMYSVGKNSPIYISALWFTHHPPVKLQGTPILKDKSNTQTIIRNTNSTEGIILNRYRCTSQRINLGNFVYMSCFSCFLWTFWYRVDSISLRQKCGKGHLDITCFNFGKCRKSTTRIMYIQKESKYIGIHFLILSNISAAYIWNSLIMINIRHILMSEICHSRRDGWPVFDPLAR